MKYDHLLKRFKPLFYRENDLVFSKGNKVFVMDYALNKLSDIFSFEESLLIRCLNQFSLFFRLHRSGVYSGVHHGEESFFSYKKALYTYHWKTKKLNKEFEFKKGSGPLKYSSIEGVEGFQDGLYFGEYYRNPSKEEIFIYKRNGEKWEVVYVFPKGEINHIHNLIADPINQCVWILAGDYGNSAGIWQATDQFRKVKQVASGQQFRACVAFPFSKGLLYATDSQFEQNTIRLLHYENNEWTSSVLCQVNGSVIYGTELKDYYVFSTSTEPGENNKGFIGSLLDNKPGPGILSNQSDVILCNKSDLSCRVLYSRKKDIYPYRLFPAGVSQSNQLFAYNVGSRKNDLATEVWDIK